MNPAQVPKDARSQSFLPKQGHRKPKHIANPIPLKSRSRRMRKLRDNILGITRPDIRRLARRGGVVRIKAEVYDEVRKVIRERLEKILEIAITLVEHGHTASYCRKTVTTSDIVYALHKLGTPVYGFGDRRGTRA